MDSSTTKQSGPRLNQLRITNFRSVGSTPVSVNLPTSGPLVVLGENNAGKSNINRAIDLLFGERWPGSFQPEQHDFHGRDADGIAITVESATSGLECDCGGDITYIGLNFDANRAEGEPCQFQRRCSSCRKTFVSRDIRAQLFCMLVGADRGLNYQLSYASKFTLLSKLMHRFHQALLSNDQRKTELATIFKSILEQFDGVEEFSTFRGFLSDMTSQLGGNLSYALDIDFSAYDPSNFFRSLRVHPHFQGEVRAFDELGSGQAEILTMSFAYAYARAFGRHSGLILVVDEPESHLHPLSQQWLAQKLDELATEGLQIVITTHSPYFVDLCRPENLVLVRRESPDSPSKAFQFSRQEFVSKLHERGADSTRTTYASVGGFYASNATTEVTSGIFAKSCVIVEGRTEAFALPELLRLVDFDPLRYGVAFVMVDGVSNLAKWHRFYDIFDIPVYPIFDTDSDKSGEAAKGPQAAREDLMRALRKDVNQASAMSTDPLSVTDLYASFSPNFEGAMKRLLGPRWNELCEEASQTVGPSKPLIARHVARNLSISDLPSELKQTLAKLAGQIMSVTPGAGDAVVGGLPTNSGS